MRTHGILANTICAVALLSAAGCGEAWVNLTASLGGDTAGGRRGSIGVIVLNNTPHRAVLTLGSYDQSGTDAQPDFFRQFELDGARVLEGNADGGSLDFKCARVFSIGGPRLLALIDSTNPADVAQDALIEGVEFFAIDAANPDSVPVSQGVAAPFEVLLGVDFPCNALLIFQLEVNDAGPQPFRIDFELIPSETTR
jgi:hypothetical protein